MKGLILAGGSGTRLWPLTKAFSKQLLPVYDKPMIYFPISTLVASGITEIAIITTPDDKSLFQKLLGTGEQLGLKFSYVVQNKPRGLAEAFLLNEEFIGNSNCALILGDNLFHGVGLGRELSKYNQIQGAQIFGYTVSNPSEYGVIEISEDNEVISIEEKPVTPKSNNAVPGLYFYDEQVVEIAKSIKPSSRGELEITSIHQVYLEMKMLKATLLPRGTAWFDTGTFTNLHDASTYVRILEQRQGIKVGCLEEVVWRKNLISKEQLLNLASEIQDISTAQYLENLAYAESG
jgi:glucose-1-phosphate thymidylyltransferase